MKRTTWFVTPIAGVLAVWLAVPAATSAKPTPKPPKTVTLSASTYNAGEASGHATIVVKRPGAGTKLTVQLTTSDGTATAPADYTATAVTVTFPADPSNVTSTQQSVQVPITNNAASNADKTFNVTLSKPSGGYSLVAPTTATVTIVNDDVPAAPVNLTAVAGAPGEIDLAWDANTDYVTGYTVQRATTSGGPYTTIGTSTTTSYQDLGLDPGGYYYVVEASNAAGNSSASNEANATPGTIVRHLYWGEAGAGTVSQANLDGSAPTTLASGSYDVWGVAVSGSHLYWADMSTGRIYAANLDGTGVTTLVAGLSWPLGLAVNASHIYWTGYGNDTIGMANLDGSGVTVIAVEQPYPTGIALDSTHLYWSNQGSGVIMRADLDGSGAAPLVSGLNNPTGVAVDSSRVYWASINLGTIEAADLDGNGVTTLVTGEYRPYGVAVDSSHLYWTNPGGPSTVVRANLDGSGVTVLLAGLSQPNMVALSPE